ncbi:MAG: AI-2E family transporter [Candidatus Binataceae bacterium]|nr:AI-2E family transporter [Candidatus Binataceae bacterium]
MAQPILAIIITAAVLYIAKDIFVPLAVASLLAVIFSPVAGRLERFVGRFASCFLVVVSAIVVIGCIGYFLTIELTSVAVQITDYTDNIATKINALRGSTPEWLQRIEGGVKDVEQQVQPPSVPKAKQSTLSTVVQIPDTRSSVEQIAKPVVPILSGLIESLFIIVLLFFLLFGRKDLRDRIVRLTARVRVTLSAEGIATATDAVGHYLLLFALTNAGYGLAIGIVMWLLGLPEPALWGLVAGLFRFIPYIGVAVASLLPSFVAVAVFPGWSKSIEVLAAYLIIDQIVSYAVEPILIGRGIGLSPLALLVSAMFWSWLWGLPGLFLATSLTACLKVAGDYIPSLGFLSVLLGAEGTLEDYNDYYRSLLELNVSGARNIAIRYCDKHGLEPTFDEVLTPAVNLAGDERSENHISAESQQLVNDTTVALVNELGVRFSKPRAAGRLRILGACAPGEVHRLGLQMLLELLRRSGAAANYLDETKSSAEIRDFVKRYAPNLVLLSCTMADLSQRAIELVRGLKLDSPNLTIICGGRGALTDAAGLLEAGASQVCESRSDMRRAIRLYALWQAVSRSPGSSLHHSIGISQKEIGSGDSLTTSSEE